jgi:hypothetical protein
MSSARTNATGLLVDGTAGTAVPLDAGSSANPRRGAGSTGKRRSRNAAWLNVLPRWVQAQNLRRATPIDAIARARRARVLPASGTLCPEVPKNNIWEISAYLPEFPVSGVLMIADPEVSCARSSTS